MKKSFKIEIDKKWCKGCEICVFFCPVKILKISEDRKAEVIDEEKCTGCLMCEYHCPDFAIFITPKETIETKEIK